MNLFRAFFIFLSVFIFSCKENSRKIEEAKEEQSGAGLALEEWSRARFSNEENIVSAASFLESYKKTKTSLRGTDKASWKAIGPKNIGGRTLCLAFHPNNPDIIYAGSASGGLWKTFSAGVGYNGWTQVPINFPVYAIASILISPKNPNILFVGTGEVYNKAESKPGIIDRFTRGTYGIGILKSIDGGITWSHSLAFDPTTISGVQELKFDPYDDFIVYAATTNGVYKSTNQGQTWTLIHNVPMAVDIDINPDNPEIIFVTHGSFNDNSISGIYRSNNSGRNFTKINAGLPASYSGKARLAISKKNPDILYASIADANKSIGLFHSIDGGLSWDNRNSKADVANVQGWYSHDIAIHEKNENYISYVGQNVYISDNGGENFLNISSWDAADFGRVPVGGKEGIEEIYVHADVHATYFHPLRPDEIYFATDGGVFVSKNKGLSFEGRNGGYQTSQFYANFTAAKNDAKFAIGGMQDNGTAIYDGQDGWIKVLGGDGMSTAIGLTNENILYCSYQYFGLNKSLDKGKSFENIRPNNTILVSEEKAFNTPYELTPANPSALYTGAQRVYINENNGNPNSWKALHSEPLDPQGKILALAVSPKDPTLLLASTSSNNNSSMPKLFRSTDAGYSWTRIKSLPPETAMDILFDPINSNIVYAVFSGFKEKSHVYKSLDSGVNWTSIDNGLPNVPTNCIAINPFKTSDIYIGNDLGVFVSSDGGTTWNKFSAGLPNAVMAMSLSISETGRVLKVATHGNGVYESPLGDFTISTKEIHNPAVLKTSINPNPASNAFTVFIQLEKPADYSINVLDLNGKVIISKTGIKSLAGNNHININCSEFAAGIYTIVLEGKITGNQSPFYILQKLIKV